MEIGSGTELKEGLSGALLGWYDFDKKKKLLYIGDSGDPYLIPFIEKGFDVDTVFAENISAGFAGEHPGEYGYVVFISCPERGEDITGRLNHLRKVIKPGGKLFFGIYNRLGLKFFCGDRDPYTGRYFDGIEGYSDPALLESKGRCYSRSELKRILNSAGFDKYKFYSVLPDLKCASFLFAEDYLPKEDLSNRVFPYYDDPDSVFLAEQSLYPSLIEEGLFHATANAFLIECAVNSELSSVLQVTASPDRGREDAAYTIIRGDGFVEKRPAFPEGAAKLERMCAHDEDLRAHGIKVIDSRMEKGSYIMPYKDLEITQSYLKRLLYSDRDKFISEMDAFRDTVLRSSERYVAEDGTEVFKKGYFDLVPLNSFREGSDLLFFDQEFCIEDLPVKVMALRQVLSFYFGDPRAEKELPKEFFLERYGLTDERERWQKIEWDFLNSLLKKVELKDHYGLHRTDPGRIKKRRAGMDLRFLNIFEGAEKKKIYLFGSGKYADAFLDVYGNDIPVAGILDNNPEKAGDKKRGIEIGSPELLRSLAAGSFKVIICVRDYEPLVKQLNSMGIRDISVYDPHRYYETRPRTSIKVIKEIIRTAEGDPQKNKDGEEAADYHCHIGYCAGAFDMFHIGHLNLLRRAKERCDYLIVGVMSDERMYNLKKKYPVIPCNERMQVVAGCRYVDQVEELPADRAGIMDAWNMFHYDCMFSGDDHAEDPGWLAERERLRQHGSDIVFVSYTKEQSSSAIRGKMKE